jgi:hypothetical protein
MTRTLAAHNVRRLAYAVDLSPETVEQVLRGELAEEPLRKLVVNALECLAVSEPATFAGVEVPAVPPPPPRRQPMRTVLDEDDMKILREYSERWNSNTVEARDMLAMLILEPGTTFDDGDKAALARVLLAGYATHAELRCQDCGGAREEHDRSPRCRGFK